MGKVLEGSGRFPEVPVQMPGQGFGGFLGDSSADARSRFQRVPVGGGKFWCRCHVKVPEGSRRFRVILYMRGIYRVMYIIDIYSRMMILL